MTHQPASWLVLGHYGGQNTGDEAMLTGLVMGCSPSLRQHLCVVSRGELPQRVTRQGVATIPTAIRPILRELIRCQGVLVGGGTHFHDDYKGTRYIRHYRYMARFVVLALLARLLGKPVLWLSMGFGPFFRFPTKLLTRLGLKLCTHVTVRDSVSAEDIAPWVHASRRTTVFDLAALITTIPTEHQATHRTRQEKDSILGISILSVQHSKTGGAATDQLFRNNLETALSDTLANHPHLRARIFIIRGGNREDDFDASARLYRALVDIDPARVDIIPHCSDPVVTFRKIQECRAFIATRFHAGVLAYLAGCNLIFLAYHRKLADLAHDIGLSPQACIPFSASRSRAILATQISELIAGQPAYRPGLPVAEAVARAQQSITMLEKYSGW